MGAARERRSVRWREGMAVFTGLWLLGAPIGSAQAPAERESPAAASPGEAPADAAASPGTPGTVKLEELEIRGEIEKPKLFFILPKAQREVEARQRRLRFYPDILEPLDKDRFEEEARVLYQHGIPAE